MGTVVVGYVATPEGEAALGRAVEEARLRQASLLVVCSHRVEHGRHPQSGEHDAEVEMVSARLESSGVPYEIRTLARGFEPAEDLLSLAEASGAELIVIGLRRRTPVGKLILGSNAQRVLLDAQCPVLAVKAEAGL